MLHLKEFRQKYGLSISEMADYLDISKSMVAKAENMERNLPLMAELKFLALKGAAIMHDEAQNTSSPALRIQQHSKIYSDMLKQMEYRLVKGKVKIGKLEKKLEKIQAAYPATAGFMELTEHLPPFIAGSGIESKKEQVWLSEMKKAASMKLQKCDMSAQIEMRIAIEMLQAEQVVLQDATVNINSLLLEITPAAEIINSNRLPPLTDQVVKIVSKHSNNKNTGK